VQRSSVGIGVSSGGGERSRLPKSRSTEHNRRAIEAEVTEKALPETTRGIQSRLSVLCAKKAKGGYELVYMAGDKKVVLPLK
jgi:hypothetical protein